VAETAQQSISNLTSDVLLKSDWTGPMLLLVQRSDGSYSYAFVKDGTLKDSHFVDSVTLEYANGDHGTVSEDGNGNIPLFISKLGQGSSARILEHIIAGVTLQDGSILPVQFTDAQIIDGKIVGNFSAITDAIHMRITGDRSASEQMLSISLQPTLQTSDVATSLIGREMLKMVVVPNAQSNVLGTTTDTGTNNESAPRILASAEPFIGMSVQQFASEGVIKISSEPVTSQTETQQLSPQFTTVNNFNSAQQSANTGSATLYYGGTGGGIGETGATGEPG